MTIKSLFLLHPLIKKLVHFKFLPSSISIFSDALRYFFVGGFNSIITFLLYQLSLFFFPANASYFFSWIAGFLIVVFFYPDNVFVSSRISRISRLFFSFLYLFNFILGIVSLSFLSSVGLGSRFSILIVLVITSFSNFFAGRFIFRGFLPPD